MYEKARTKKERVQIFAIKIEKNTRVQKNMFIAV